MSSTTEPAQDQRQHAATGTSIELEIGGMTCASCANRVQRKLNKLPGTTALVNYATEKAQVTLDQTDQTTETPSVEDLVAAVEAAGYTATLPVPPRTADAESTADGEAAADPAEAPVRALRQRLLISLVLSVPVVALAMVPAWQFTNWQWLSLMLAFPVVTWGAWPFHRAAWTNAKHGTSTMDTLVSMGVIAAFAWSLWALFFGTAGEPGGAEEQCLDRPPECCEGAHRDQRVHGRRTVPQSWSRQLGGKATHPRRRPERRGSETAIASW